MFSTAPGPRHLPVTMRSTILAFAAASLLLTQRAAADSARVESGPESAAPASQERTAARSRAPVTDKDAPCKGCEPCQQTADEANTLWYVRLGGGATIGGNVPLRPSMGLGYRYALDWIGLDLSFLNLTWDADENAFGNGSYVSLIAYIFAAPHASSSFYAGGGLSWGVTSVSDGLGHRYGGEGIQADLSAGYELLRAHAVRLFVQTDATLPFYRSTGDSTTFSPSSWPPPTSWYSPTFVVALGVGFGRSPQAASSAMR